MKTNLLFPLVFCSPVIAYGDGYDDTSCPALDPGDLVDFANSDTNRLQGTIAKALARMTPFTDVLQGGTFPAGVSSTQRSVVQGRAILNNSLVSPQFIQDIEICGETGETAEVGSTEYNYSIATLRGMGPLVCLHKMRDSFEGSYMAAEDALRKAIKELSNADVRYQLATRSGGKLIVKSNTEFTDMYAGDYGRVDMPYDYNKTGAPDSPINFALLDDLGTFMREDLLVDGFEGDASEPLLKFIGSQSIITRLRNEIGIREDHRYLTAGSYNVGKNALLKYRWEGPYRGWAFGTDPQPLRFSTFNNQGQPNFIEPEIAVTTSKGRESRINPPWVRARYELALAIGADSFKKLAPAQYTGEGSFRFPSQLYSGELKFKVIADNCKNVWEDFGRHFYQITRGYQPVRPHAVTAIIFKRAKVDYGLTPVSDQSSNWSSTDSL